MRLVCAPSVIGRLLPSPAPLIVQAHASAAKTAMVQATTARGLRHNRSDSGAASAADDTVTIQVQMSKLAVAVL